MKLIQPPEALLTEIHLLFLSRICVEFMNEQIQS
jgi:hypothetical protein